MAVVVGATDPPRLIPWAQLQPQPEFGQAVSRSVEGLSVPEAERGQFLPVVLVNDVGNVCS
jgi:hypothetical protein